MFSFFHRSMGICRPAKKAATGLHQLAPRRPPLNFYLISRSSKRSSLMQLNRPQYRCVTRPFQSLSVRCGCLIGPKLNCLWTEDGPRLRSSKGLMSSYKCKSRCPAFLQAAGLLAWTFIYQLKRIYKNCSSVCFFRQHFLRALSLPKKPARHTTKAHHE